MIDSKLYRRMVKVRSMNDKRGGQELILAEIVGALAGMKRVWIPFLGSGSLALALEEVGIETFYYRDRDSWDIGSWPQDCDAVYFGTPTIVQGKILFPESVFGNPSVWSKSFEREVVRHIVSLAESRGSSAKRIVCGWGSGDVRLYERMRDLNPANKGPIDPSIQVACTKHFTEEYPSGLCGHFSDYVIVRNLYLALPDL